jgi:antirestriction protein ArdC
MEELGAELASAFIACELGIAAEIPQYASYIDNWLVPLKKDNRETFRTAADAQKIIDMVLAFHPDFAAQAESYPSRPASTIAKREASGVTVNLRLLDNFFEDSVRASGSSLSRC